MESLNSDVQTLYIQELLAPVFIGLDALLIGEIGLKKIGNTSFRVKELEFGTYSSKLIAAL
ncbi:MAG: hypothetical protein WBK51_03615 [Polaromonas sp.]